VSSSTTDKPRGQSLDGEALDVSLLDSRVHEWKSSLNLYHQDNFPPKNFPINPMGEKFHDRSHILLQDFLQRTSEDFSRVYGESSLPSVYEEVLTYFCAQITHKPEEGTEDKVSPSALKDKIQFLKHIGYVPSGSVFETEIDRISFEMSVSLCSIASDSDLEAFKRTLIYSTRDCPGWDRLDG
jgi:hypothetical protein